MISSEQLPQRFKTGLEDQIFFWMDSQFDSQNHAVMTLNGRLDKAILNRAARLTLMAEPVLGCRYVPATWRQYWERLENPESCALVSVIETDGEPDDISRFLEINQPINHLIGPQVHFYLLRSPENDILCIKISHVAGDGGGVRDLCYLVSDIYTKLIVDPDYIPEINIGGSRSLTQVTKVFGFMDMLKILRRSLRDMKGIFLPFIFKRPSFEKHTPDDRAYEIAVIEKQTYIKIRDYASSLGVTVNDVITAAFFRAFYTLVNADPKAFLRLVITVNLRRFLPDQKAESICGLSGFIYMNIGQHLGETLRDTVHLVHNYMKAIKNDYPGLGGSFPMTWLFFKTLPFKLSLFLHTVIANQMKKQYIHPGKVAPLLTNTGALEKKHLNFGGISPTSVFFSAPLSYPPVFATTVTTYEDQMTFCVGFCEKTLPRHEARKLFRFLIDELPA
ncbi:MAG: hypothetical protein KJ737_09150 [Proteobacteria bacterium]|nr:hypothetical protein [Pseudomonadota bacterium]